MEDLHKTFGEAHLDFEIDSLQADMIKSIVSVKLGTHLEYDELTVVEWSAQWCTIIVNTTGQIVQFRPP